MNKFFILCLGLSLIVPATSSPLSKKKIIPIAKIIVGGIGILGTALVLNNIAKTASRRIANPEYSGSSTSLAILGQMASILMHNKGLFAGILATAGLSIFCVANGVNDLCQDSSETNQ